MIKWVDFKTENNVDKVPFLKGKGREFAVVNGKTIVIASNFDENKEAFIWELTEDKLGNPLTNVFMIGNSSAVVSRVL